MFLSEMVGIFSRVDIWNVPSNKRKIFNLSMKKKYLKPQWGLPEAHHFKITDKAKA